MAKLDRTLSVRPSTFSANSKVYSAGPEGLANAIRNLQASMAADLAIAGATADWSVADSSTAVGTTLVVGDATGGFAEDIFTITDTEISVPTGHPVVFRGSDLPDGITAGTTYYVIRLQGSGQAGTKDGNRIQVAASQKQAEMGEQVEFADDGSGTQWIERQIALPTPLPIYYGTTGATLGLLDTQMAATMDTHLETLASVINALNAMRVDLDMPVLVEGSLTGAIDTVAAIVAIATANTSDDDAADYSSVVAAELVMNNAIKTVAMSVNDLAAAVGQVDSNGVGEYLDFLSPHLGTESDTGTIGPVVAATSAVGGYMAGTVLLTDFNKSLIVWETAIGNILQRVSEVSATAQSIDNWAQQLIPSVTEVLPVKPGLRTRQRHLTQGAPEN